MTKPEPTWPPPPNPDYEVSPVTWVVIDGIRCVEIDGGKLAEMAALHLAPGMKPARGR